MRNMWIGLVLVLFFSVVQGAAYNVTNANAYTSTDFGIKNFIQTPDRVYAGDEVRLRFDMNNGGVEDAKNVQVTSLVPFLTEKQTFFLGSLLKGQSEQVVVDFQVPAGTKPGNYNVFVYVIDELGKQAQVGEIPIVVNDPQSSNAIIASLDSSNEIIAGGITEPKFIILNIGNQEAQDIIIQIQYSASSAFTPIGSDRVYIKSIKPGENTKIDFQMGINPAANPGYYPLTILINYKIDMVTQTTITQIAGMKVVAKTNLLMTYEQSTSTSTSPSITVTVANTGDTAVRGVYLSATSKDVRFTGASDRFIGTLNLDDTASMTLTPASQLGRNGSRNIQIKVTYKDALNIEHTQTKDIELGGALGDGSALNSINGQGSANQRFGRQQQNSSTFGIDPLTIGIIIVLLLAAFFGYKWVKRREK
jgi:hypothetical protein